MRPATKPPPPQINLTRIPWLNRAVRITTAVITTRMASLRKCFTAPLSGLVGGSRQGDT